MPEFDLLHSLCDATISHLCDFTEIKQARNYKAMARYHFIEMVLHHGTITLGMQEMTKAFKKAVIF